MAFKPNRKFKRDYDKAYRQDPLAANLFLLIAELADDKGQLVATEEELAELMEVRFNDPREYSI